ncbi:MAG TPA: peroxiredoxin [Planctomycetota bacterium]|nr:peroxiredoxin [Planctomycetota bacterium]
MAVLVTREAPDFTATALMPDGSFKADFKLSDYRGKNVVLFFYPLDFTFVCPSEIIAFHNRADEFKSRNTQVIGCSVDSHFTHLAWSSTAIENGGIGKLSYPLVADLNKTIAARYDVLLGNKSVSDKDGSAHFELGGAVALRGSFLIDTKGIVRHQVVNDLPLGRNIDEMLRMVDALDFHTKHGEVCPAGWDKSKKAMKASKEGVAAYLKENAGAL